MTPHQIALVRQSFTKVLPIKETTAALFYDRLFAVDPSTRPLFRYDMAAQGAKLMAAIAMVVWSLDNLEPMLEKIRATPDATSSTALRTRTMPASTRPCYGRSNKDSVPTLRPTCERRGHPLTTCSAAL